MARHQRCSGGNRDGESSAPAAFVYVAEVTRERRNRSAGTHTRSPPDPFRAPAHHAPGNEHTSLPGADRIDVAPRAERCVCLPLRNDAVQSQARSRRCSFHSARNRRQALKASSQRRHALAFVQDVCSPQWRTIAHGRRLMSDSIQTSVWLGKSLAVVFARVALFDLCRVSFVERDSSGKYGGGDGVVNAIACYSTDTCNRSRNIAVTSSPSGGIVAPQGERLRRLHVTKFVRRVSVRSDIQQLIHPRTPSRAKSGDCDPSNPPRPLHRIHRCCPCRSLRKTDARAPCCFSAGVMTCLLSLLARGCKHGAAYSAGDDNAGQI